MRAADTFSKFFAGLRAFFLRDNAQSDSFVRSVKRAYYQPGGSADAPEEPEEPPKKPRKRLSFFYVLVTLVLLVFAYPVGLVLLWIRKFKARAILKMAISIAGCVVFLCLFSVFLSATQLNPALAPLQAKVRSAFSFYGDDSKVVVEQYEGRLSVFPEDISNVTFHTIRYAQRTLAENIKLLGGRHARVAEKSKDLLYVTLLRATKALGRSALVNPEPAHFVSSTGTLETERGT